MMEESSRSMELAHYIEKYSIDEILKPKLLNHLKLIEVAPYETLIAEQSHPEYLYFLVEGQIKCARYHSNGTLAVVQMMHPFSLLGDVELINKNLTDIAAVATLPSILLAVKADIIRREGLDEPALLRFISEELVRKLHDSTALRLGHLLPVISRLALFIISKPGVEEGKIIILPEKETLASMVGTTYRHLNRVFKELKEEGTLGSGYPGVRILDLKKLQKHID